MIAIVSSAPQERTALAALCASRGWLTTDCDSLRAFRRMLRRVCPRIVLTRHRLADGYSDDVISALAAGHPVAAVNVVVLIGAGTPSSVEARQVALGVDCVQRDPVRTDVLVEYLAKFLRGVDRTRSEMPPTILKAMEFAGGCVDPVERTVRAGKKVGHLTPHEVALVELLVQSEGGIVTYDTLYSEILDRRFRGETSNMRVLLGKLVSSARQVGLPIRRWVGVIPKMGYRYRKPLPESPPVPKPRTATRPKRR